MSRLGSEHALYMVWYIVLSWVVVVKFKGGAIKVRLQCSSHNLPDSGLPCNARKIGSTIRLSNFVLNFFSYHSAYASSILMYVVMLDPGEWAYASFASPPNTFLL